MVAMFFCDVDRALRELSVGRARSPSLGLQLLPVGLGAAVRHSNAVFVPGRDELVAAQEAQLAAPSEAAAMLAEAGLPSPVARWDEEHIPLFSCMRLVRRRPDGTRFSPLFMSSEDAKEAIAAAARSSAAAQGGSDLQMDCTSLPKLLALPLPARRRFRVVPPTRSMLYLQGQGRQVTPK
ncbi:hypothetical protein EMIHUDRAFT_434011 [Emiliania huxleyi CCMP1516]|uniref:Uncharacterized protein n=2 Tax=Emiliania huxleyi TaxID=2903 RepID=A0A0D3KBG6_EMIH1|nr:hypothetical protein EMIHUDRAFT_446309 [Emiliania huxleyi CCMP1516]XP_005785530.1 hypothetical protein EMIHUDRAFT_434011 [Emiliania huxleyi CCMP1516]EOD08897.1 hypothetical protein EMIHUDRAFT_446309 [Emiliania huxleyi CCMP1516]EOD33101.1 hypothetical protein EMIHUDRAFT_434011 [Emiliania huxleyi CCMP1516]|eukprot:XP_005761326.1 hypothetical protein EMIHUDRAFT_446309 [Emiliania huxleyi CCMP1516]